MDDSYDCAACGEPLEDEALQYYANYNFERDEMFCDACIPDKDEEV